MTKTKKVKNAVKTFFLMLLATKELAQHCDAWADCYGFDKDDFAEAVFKVFEDCIKDNAE